ncbi:sulfite exporter TauE/SafE family protein [Streptomyces katrae]|uniref:Sulfite exporter TauE/SafE family protein n=1 Tax=Streptomyces katrae TaxID=68223 RepID=A0ABT7GLJ1_9ACTN|nr:sulfite exporter TauE/SafE family protein [Streptomyces katrae]MDK9494453.1 sulfite exporter TauE/SafE family protein [Streptomyces katrae]
MRVCLSSHGVVHACPPPSACCSAAPARASWPAAPPVPPARRPARRSRIPPHPDQPRSAPASRRTARPGGAFLVGKLLSHTALGLLLGIFGSALQPSPRTRAVLLIAAGPLMVFFALDLLGIKAVSRLVPRPPAAFGRLVRGRTKSSSRLAPAGLAFATVLDHPGAAHTDELLAAVERAGYRAVPIN